MLRRFRAKLQPETAIRRVVADYLADHPPPPGEDGRNGADAPPVTDAQIADAVARYLADHPPPPGEPGPPGQPGPACPDSYELREVVLLSPDGGTYDGLTCMRDEPTPTTTPDPRPGRATSPD